MVGDLLVQWQLSYRPCVLQDPAGLACQPEPQGELAGPEPDPDRPLPGAGTPRNPGDPKDPHDEL